jgi:ribosomal-protein-alanine N-acetyltransferase
MALIRSGILFDVPSIVAIVAESPTAPQWSAAEFAVMMMPEPGATLQRRVLVAEDEGAVAGFAVYTLLMPVFPPDAELESLAVGTRYRRRGLAAALLAAVKAAAVAAGAQSLLLEVRSGNAPALALYRVAGFHLAGIRKGYYASPSEDAVLMQLPLPQYGLSPSND